MAVTTSAQATCKYTIKVVNTTNKWVKLRHLAVKKKGKKIWVRTGDFGKDPGENLIDHWFRHVYRLKPKHTVEEGGMFLARKSLSR